MAEVATTLMRVQSMHVQSQYPGIYIFFALTRSYWRVCISLGRTKGCWGCRQFEHCSGETTERKWLSTIASFLVLTVRIPSSVFDAQTIRSLNRLALFNLTTTFQPTKPLPFFLSVFPKNCSPFNLATSFFATQQSSYVMRRLCFPTQLSTFLMQLSPASCSSSSCAFFPVSFQLFVDISV